MHFLGDIHQPLHCVAHCDSHSPKGDAGGNLFYVDNGNYSANVKNLHSFWDSGAGQFDEIEDGGTELEQAKEIPGISKKIIQEFPQDYFLNAGFKISSNIGDEGTFLKWGEESFDLAKNVAYDPSLTRTESCHGNKNCAKIPDAYRETAQTLIRKRIALGGYRLAAFIEEFYSPSVLKCEEANGRIGGNLNGISVGIFIISLVVVFVVGLFAGAVAINKFLSNRNSLFSYQPQVGNSDIEFTTMREEA